MSEFQYQPLSTPTNIRLLRLLPKEQNDTTCLYGELFDYSIQTLDDISHPYEALSYAWESEDKPHDLVINTQAFKITTSLHAALHQLRYPSYERILWIDAVCINQQDTKEKETQIPMMAEIYANARSVLVWLGLGDEDSDQAMSTLYSIGSVYAKSEISGTIQASITRLLGRPWFQRIWIVQEVGVARHVQIICGHTEIDGHAFSVGVNRSTNISSGPALAICNLIQGAIFRPRRFMQNDLREAGLDPDYSLPWALAMKQLVHLLLGDKITVTTWNDQEKAEIQGKCEVIRRVVEIHFDQTHYLVTATIEIFQGRLRSKKVDLDLKPSSTLVEKADILCLLQGSKTLTLIRWEKHHFATIMIAAKERADWFQSTNWLSMNTPLEFNSDLILLWDWQSAVGRHRSFDPNQEQSNAKQVPLVISDLKVRLQRAARSWNDLTIRYHNITLEASLCEMRRLAIVPLIDEVKNCLRAMAQEHPWHFENCDYGRFPLSLAVLSGEVAIVRLIVDSDTSKLNHHTFGRTPLSYAAERGFDTIVRVLLDTGKVDVNKADSLFHEPVPLHWCTKYGHEKVVRMLLNHRGLDVGKLDRNQWNALMYAAGSGYVTVARVLLDTGKFDVNSGQSRTPLAIAAGRGHIEMDKSLLTTGNFDIHEGAALGESPLIRAAKAGHVEMVGWLLQRPDIKVEMVDGSIINFLANAGHEQVLKLLLKHDQTEVDRYGSFRRTPLFNAAQLGHTGIVRILLDTGRVDINKGDINGVKPITIAARKGHKAIVQMLTDAEAMNASSVGRRHRRTGLFYQRR